MIVGPHPLIIAVKTVVQQPHCHHRGMQTLCWGEVWEYLINVKQGEWFTDGGSNHTQHLMRDIQWNTGPVSGMFVCNKIGLWLG